MAVDLVLELVEGGDLLDYILTRHGLGGSLFHHSTLYFRLTETRSGGRREAHNLSNM